MEKEFQYNNLCVFSNFRAWAIFKENTNKYFGTFNKPSRISLHILNLILLAVIFSSCQKIINIDLNSASPVTVIVGNISDQSGPFYVTITKTVNFSASNVFPPVSGAIVVISDFIGNSDTVKDSDTLKEQLPTSPGLYRTEKLPWMVPGKRYELSVTSNGSAEYVAYSSMPLPVKIDTIKIVNDLNPLRRKRKEIEIDFRDPAGIANYYHPAIIINGEPKITFSVFNDNNSDGKEIFQNIGRDSSQNFNPGDTVSVALYSIDKATYDYFRTVRLASGEGGEFLSPSPANPISNFNNGALGYFGAYSITYKSVILK